MNHAESYFRLAVAARYFRLAVAARYFRKITFPKGGVIGIAVAVAVVVAVGILNITFLQGVRTRACLHVLPGSHVERPVDGLVQLLLQPRLRGRRMVFR